MQNSENNYDGAERKERKKNKIIIFNSKKGFGKGSFIYDVHKKSFKLWSSLSYLSANFLFWSELSPLLDILNWHSIPPTR